MSPLLILPLLAALQPGSYRLDVNVVVMASVPVLGEQRTVTSTTRVAPKLRASSLRREEWNNIATKENPNYEL